MTKRLLILCFIIGVSYLSEAVPEHNEPDSQEYLTLSFAKKPLSEIAETLAQKKGINLLLPQAAADMEALRQQVVTFQPRKRAHLTLQDAWNLLYTFLELSGFSLVQKKDKLFAIVRNASVEGGGAVNRETLPLYVDTKPQNLPKSDERIRYIYYFGILKVPTVQEKETAPLTKMIKELLSKEGTVLFDQASNGAILTDKASHIASIVWILDEFERRGFREEVAFVPLHNVPAADIVTMFNTLKKASGDTEARGTTLLQSTGTFFTKDTTVIADIPRNAVIVMGSRNNVDNISEFITESMDKPPESGSSILHYYDLQYLDAQTFAPALQKIVASIVLSGPQAQQAAPRYGREHIFKGVQVIPESLVELKPLYTTEEITYEKEQASEDIGIQGNIFLGGNRIIIAAWNDDWVVIKKLIQKLDKPQYQIVLEMIVVEFTYDATAQLNAATRSRTNSTLLPPGVQFLADNITPVNNLLGNTPTQLAEDLLQVIGPSSVSNQLTSGSTVISFNDPQTPGIWGLLQLLHQVVNSKIESFPFLLITNNKQGSIESSQIRRVNGELVTTTNGSYTIPLIDLTATFKITATPRIASEDRVRLDIEFTSDEFQSPTSNTRLTHYLNTTATLSPGQILAMGGLLRIDENDTITRTPIIGRIPLVGNFFRGTNLETIQTNVCLFASPLIIKPISRKPLTDKTKDKIREISPDTVSPYNERDPISRLFFKQPQERIVRDMCSDSTNLNTFISEVDIKQINLLKKNKPLEKKDAPLKKDQLTQLLAGLDKLPSPIKQRKG